MSAVTADLNASGLAYSRAIQATISIFQLDKADLEGMSVGVSFLGPGGLGYLVQYRSKGIEDLFDDPSISESEIDVNDQSLRIAAGVGLAGGRLAFGIGINGAWSTVIATHGQALFADLGFAGRIHKKLALGIVARRIGTSFDWEDATGREFETSLAPGVRAGIVLGPIDTPPLNFSLFADVEDGSSFSPEYGVGLRARIQTIAELRSGLADYATGDAFWTAGLGIGVAGTRLDISYEAINVTGPRIQFSLAFPAGLETYALRTDALPPGRITNGVLR